MDDSQLNTQQLAVVANFLTIQEAWEFLTDFEKNFSFASICSRTFKSYSKFEYGYWFDWVLIIEDINAGRHKIRNCFGSSWIESGDDEIWNANNKEELSIPIWVKLSAPNLINVEEASQLNLEPRMEQAEASIGVSNKGIITGRYPI
jgi:hypothetical protein